MGGHGGEEGFHGGLRFGGGLLVCLGENEREGHGAFSQPVDEIDIDALRGDAGIDEGEDAAEVFPGFQVVAYGFVEIDFFTPGDLGEAVSRKIDEAPILVHDEEVQQLGFPRGRGDFGEAILVG